MPEFPIAGSKKTDTGKRNLSGSTTQTICELSSICDLYDRHGCARSLLPSAHAIFVPVVGAVELRQLRTLSAERWCGRLSNDIDSRGPREQISEVFETMAKSLRAGSCTRLMHFSRRQSLLQCYHN